MKKTLKNKFILIISLIFIVTLIPTKVYGKEESQKNKPPYINARCAIAIDKDTGIVLFEKISQRNSSYCKYHKNNDHSSSTKVWRLG